MSENSNPSDETNDTRSDKAKKRRRFIYEQVSLLGRLSYSELRKDFPCHNTTIRQDIQFFRDHGIGMTAEDGPNGDRVLINEDQRHMASKDQRSRINQAEKRAVSRLAMGLICGFPDRESDSENWAKIPHREDGADFYYQLRRCPSRRQILEQLDPKHFSIFAHAILNTRQSLEAYWKEYYRRIMIDAGTTNDETARFLKRLMLPTAFSNFSSLSVCTNSRSIFNDLGDPRISTRVTVVGGQQVGKTESIAGPLSELFLQEAAVLQFGLSIVGSTLVDLDEGRFFCCSDSEEEARLKQITFSRSALRVVCVDDRKFRRRGRVREIFEFCAIHPEQMDIIVTNTPIKSRQESAVDFADRTARFRRFVDSIKERGVAVLESDPPSTG